MKTTAVLSMLGLVLAACGAERADQETAADSESRGSLIEPMTDAMDEAKAVEDKVMEQKAAVDAALEDAEKSTDEAATDE